MIKSDLLQGFFWKNVFLIEAYFEQSQANSTFCFTQGYQNPRIKLRKFIVIIYVITACGSRKAGMMALM